MVSRTPFPFGNDIKGLSPLPMTNTFVNLHEHVHMVSMLARPNLSEAGDLSHDTHRLIQVRTLSLSTSSYAIHLRRLQLHEIDRFGIILRVLAILYLC